MNGMTPGVSAFGLVFEREREDKTPNSADIRISQLTDLCPFEEQQTAIGGLEKMSIARAEDISQDNRRQNNAPQVSHLED